MPVKGYITPGLSKVFWLVTLGSVTAPSAADVNAGTELTPALRGMPDAPRSGNTADDSALDSRIDLQQRGTITLGAVTLTMKRTKATETEYNALNEDDIGFLVVFRKGTAGASPAAADVADVYTADVQTKGPAVPGRNEVDFSTVELINTAETEFDSVLVA